MEHISITFCNDKPWCKYYSKLFCQYICHMIKIEKFLYDNVKINFLLCTNDIVGKFGGNFIVRLTFKRYLYLLLLWYEGVTFCTAHSSPIFLCCTVKISTRHTIRISFIFVLLLDFFLLGLTHINFHFFERCLIMRDVRTFFVKKWIKLKRNMVSVVK